MKKLLIWLMAMLLCLPWAVAEEKDNHYDALGYDYHEDGLLSVQRNGLWGVIAADGTLIIPCEWEEIGTIIGGRIPVKRNGLWGCIDLQGHVVVEPVWDFLSVWSDGTMDVDRDGYTGLLSTDGEIIIPCGTYAYVGWNIDGFYLVADKQGNNGKLNLDGTVAIPLEWAHIDYFCEGLASAAKTGGTYCYINTAGETVIPGPFTYAGDFKDGLALVRNWGLNEDWLFIDQQDNSLTSTGWEDAEEFSCGLALVKRDGLYGYIDRTGELVIPLQFTSASSFYNGVALVRQGEERIAINTQGDTLYTCVWDRAGGKFWGGFIWVQQDGLYGLMNTAGELVVPCEWDDYVGMPFLLGDMMAMKKADQLGFVNKQGELITGQLWDEAAISYRIQDEYLFLLEDGVLSIWHADGTQLY
nr:WG repeat-containing protein [Clostridia bacterium]